MGTGKDKQLRAAMPDSPPLTRLRWALITVFSLGRRDLPEGNGGAERAAQE